MSFEQVRELLEDYLSWDIVINTAESVLEAFVMERSLNIWFWDALILHAAETSDAKVVYSEDLTNGQSCGAFRVINPLIDAGAA